MAPFASKFASVIVAGRSVGDAIGGTAAGLVVLAVELALTQGPKYSAWLRRWLEPRAVFEGGWIQAVWEGQTGNVVAIVWLDYEHETDSFAVTGHAYSIDGRPWAKWTSTHMFIDTVRLKATYRWEGELVGVKTPDPEKTGLTDMELRHPPIFSLPMTGEGRVSHVGEGTRVKFRLHRVTSRMLTELDLPFTFRQLQIDEHDEEARLVEAFLVKRARLSAAQVAP